MVDTAVHEKLGRAGGTFTSRGEGKVPAMRRIREADLQLVRVMAISRMTGVAPQDVDQVLLQYLWLIRNEIREMGSANLPSVGTLRHTIKNRAKSGWPYSQFLIFEWHLGLLWNLGAFGKVGMKEAVADEFEAAGCPRTYHRTPQFKKESLKGTLPTPKIMRLKGRVEPRPGELAAFADKLPKWNASLHDLLRFASTQWEEAWSAIQGNEPKPIPAGAAIKGQWKLTEKPVRENKT